MTLHEELKHLFQKSADIDVLLIQKLQEAEKIRLFEKFGYPSLFKYVVSQFNVSESKAYLLISTSRKCIEVPKLQQAISSGELSVSKAKPILSVVEKDPELWIEKAKTLSKDQVERAVANQNPEMQVREQMKPIAPNLVEFKCGISCEEEDILKRSREMASRTLGRQASWRETLRFMGNDYLDKRDPVRKAERAELRKHGQPRQLSPGRVRNPASKKLSAQRVHEVSIRDRDECQYPTSNGKCGATKFTEIHHIIKRAMGGTDDLDNLTTLCSFHHDMTHGFESKRYAKPKISECWIEWKPFPRKLALLRSSSPYVFTSKANSLAVALTVRMREFVA